MSISSICAAIITLLFAVMLAHVLINIAHEAEGQSVAEGPSIYETNPSHADAHLTAMDREALDTAYRNYRERLFEQWMKDPSQQPKRAIFGAEKARDVYLKVLKAIDERKVQ